ncbi:hypothetical protein MRX96_035025 [Rhipicephalus microplus]
MLGTAQIWVSGTQTYPSEKPPRYSLAGCRRIQTSGMRRVHRRPQERPNLTLKARGSEAREMRKHIPTCLKKRATARFVATLANEVRMLPTSGSAPQLPVQIFCFFCPPWEPTFDTPLGNATPRLATGPWIVSHCCGLR